LGFATQAKHIWLELSRQASLIACTCQESFGVALCDQSREADDIVDEGGTDAQKSAELRRLRLALDAACAGHPDELMMSALATTVERYKLDKKHLADVIDGWEMDPLEGRVEGRPNRLA
jgi:phytoene/squalene synthetase